MAANFAPSLAFTLAEEGGFVDDPADPGGATNHGVTLGAYREWAHNPNLTAADLQAISPTTVAAIYEAFYWGPMRCADLPPGIDLGVFDFGVNAGPAPSVKALQALVGTQQDGIIGPRTLQAAGQRDPLRLIAAFDIAARAHYLGLADFAVFGRGWFSRCDRRRVAAFGFLNDA